MLILAFDTTSDQGGAAIYRDEECLACEPNRGPAHNYSITLFQMVDRLVEATRAKTNSTFRGLADIELYAVANGPGSFTGTRVGLAAAQAWAKAFERPVRGVSALEALVEAARPETEVAVPLLDAHRGEFYVAKFRQATTPEGMRFVAAGEGRVLKPDRVKEFLATPPGLELSTTCIARAEDKQSLGLAGELAGSLRRQIVSGTMVPAIAHIGYRAAREGKLQAPHELDAYYIRRTDAELNLKES